MTPDPTYVPDPAKLANHARLDKSPRHSFIKASWTAVHLGLRRDALGDRSGLILSVGYVAACSGKQIGAPWGYSKEQIQPVGSKVCDRCVRYAEKHGIALSEPLS